MKSMHRLMVTASTILAFSGVVGAPVAQAADTKIQSAATCFYFSGLGVPVRDALGRFLNTSVAAEINILCPVLRDNLVAAPIAVRVGVRDVSTTLVGADDISCRVQGATQIGTGTFTGPFTSTPNGANPNGTVLNLTLPAIPNNASLNVFCTIPRRGVNLLTTDPPSWVASIFIDEP